MLIRVRHNEVSPVYEKHHFASTVLHMHAFCFNSYLIVTFGLLKRKKMR